VAHGDGYSLAISPGAAEFALLSPARRGAAPRHAVPPVGLRMELVNGAADAVVSGQSLLPGRMNYLGGPDPSSWRTGIPTYARVQCAGVYPGIDLLYYGSQRKLEYDFVVSPGADPSKIALRFAGSRRVTLDRSGDLDIAVKGGSVRWHKPVAYQVVAGKRRLVAGQFQLKRAGVVGFEVARYDRRQPLVIDPVLGYSTYLGGTGTDTADAIALDTDGNAYVTGLTTSNDFPGAVNPPGATGGFVAKIDPTGSHLVYSTYIGSAVGQGIAVDIANQAYVVGYIESAGLSVINGAQSTFGGQTDGFLMKLNDAGTGIAYSTYLGGSAIDVARAVAIGPDGTIFITGPTGSTNFPTVSPYQAAGAGLTDSFVARIDTTKSGAASLLYSTYLGGTGGDFANAIAVDSSGRFFVAGSTNSSDFPTKNAFQPAISGGEDAFLTVFAANGTLLYSTYFGGSSVERAMGLAVDNSLHAYISGVTFSLDLPLRGVAHNPYMGNGDVFVAEINCGVAGNAGLVYSCYLGNPGSDASNGLALDVWGNAYITGVAALPTPKPFVVRIGPGGTFQFQAVIGGSTDDEGAAIAVDPLGNAFVAGTANSTDFPTTPGAVQTSGHVTGSSSDGFVYRIPTFTKLDLNGDTIPDLLFQNTGTTQLVYWQMRGPQLTAFHLLNPSTPGANWNLAATADINGDNSTDLLLQNSTTGDLVYWLMNGPNAVGTGFMTPRNPGANWNLVGAADFDRDGYTDLLFQNSVSGDLFIWYMRAATQIGGGYVTPRNPGAGWRVAAVGDLNGDGQADIVFQNRNSGDVYVWYLHRGIQIGGGYLNPRNPGSGWDVAGLADINGDGKLEILFQNRSSGLLAYWTLSGLNLTGIGLPSPNNPGSAAWKLVGSN
jgi:hypothetical protein